MAKNMARIKNGIVSNIEWCANNQAQTDDLIDLGDRPVIIGDCYTEGKFYRNGIEVLTPLEEAYKTIADMKAALEVLGVSE